MESITHCLDSKDLLVLWCSLIQKLEMIYFIFLILTFTHVSYGNQTAGANHVDLPSFLKSLTDLRGKLIDLMGSFNPDFDTGHQGEGRIAS